MKLRALAKINLGLDVTGKREDGYHEVRMVMQTIQMYDQLEIKESKEPGIRLTTNLPFLPCNDGNLVYKAAKILMDEFDIRQGVDMNLTKFIPVAAGMAGGSSDAAAALVGAEKAAQNPNHRGDEEYNYFMAVCFPAEQLTIIDYNRVVKDLNGLTPQAFLEALKKNFVVEEKGTDIYRPAALHNFSLYLEGKWYSLTAKPGTYDDNDPIGVLDVTISSNLILDEILGIKDLRSDKRIDFVGGIRGLGELKKRVDSGEMKMALALYPVSMKQLMDIADTGNIMPPKTTWFEPKLRSGLVIHKLE